jgi:hypothetical protein
VATATQLVGLGTIFLTLPTHLTILIPVEFVRQQLVYISPDTVVSLSLDVRPFHTALIQH